MLEKIIEKVIVDVIGKGISLFWKKIFIKKKETIKNGWDDTAGDYVAGKRQPIIKDNVDINKWNKSG